MRSDNQDSYEIISKSSRNVSVLCGRRDDKQGRVFFFLLYEAHRTQHMKSFSGKQKPAECKADFRVEKMDIPLLVDVLGIPSMFTCRFGTICDGTEDLCNYACIREFPRGHGLELR